MPTAIRYNTNITASMPKLYNSYITYPQTPRTLSWDTSKEEIIKLVERVVNDPEWLKWMKMRYTSKSHASFCFKTAKMYLVDVLRNPAILKQLNYRRARGVIEAITPLRDYVKIRYGIELRIDTKILWKFMPAKPISEVTNAILEYELTENGGKDIITMALEKLEEILGRNSKFKIPTVIAFFTGLRAPEIKYMIDNWERLRKIEVVSNVMLIELNYDRIKKKAYITLMPKQLYDVINNNYMHIKLTHEWRNHLLHKFGIALGIMRKAWIAITSRYLDPAERDLLQGRLRSVQVKHYVKHVKSIASRYYEAFKPYLHLVASLSGT